MPDFCEAIPRLAPLQPAGLFALKSQSNVHKCTYSGIALRYQNDFERRRFPDAIWRLV